VHRAAATGTGLVLGFEDDLLARQVLRQGAAVDTALPPARRWQRRVVLLVHRFGLGDRLLDILERQLQLVGMSDLLRAPTEERALQLLEDRPQALVLVGEPLRPGMFCQEQRLEGRHVVRQRARAGGAQRVAHGGSGTRRTGSATS
jgi:hypothetical protein